MKRAHLGVMLPVLQNGPFCRSRNWIWKADRRQRSIGSVEKTHGRNPEEFDEPDEVRYFEKGKFELVHIGGVTIGRATYAPGWKWSEHVGRSLGKTSCDVEHVGIVLSGRATATMNDGRMIEMKSGDIFYIAPGHDSWVVGDEPYVSLHLVGAADYASHKSG